jgi:HK97 gp10 family phage protein
MKTRVRIEGLKDLDRALGELPRATARATLKRVLLKAGRPIAEAAKLYAPVDKGDLKDDITVSAKIKNDVGKKEFTQAMRRGDGTAAAVKAMRSARREAGGEGSFAEVGVGPTTAHPEAIFPEFGVAPHDIKPKTRNKSGKLVFNDGGETFGATVIHHPGAAPTPFMRPAFEARKHEALKIIETELSGEIAKAAARVAKRRARKTG